MTMTSSATPTLRPSELKRSLDLVEVKPGVKFSLAVLKELLPDVETLLFFAKVYELDAPQLASLLLTVRNTDLTRALFGESGDHSHDLQGYLVGEYACSSCGGYDRCEDCTWVPGILDPTSFNTAGLTFSTEPVPQGEILPEVWTQLEVEVADSIKGVAAKLEGVVALLPGKQGQMVFSSMMKLNAKRPTIGEFRTQVHHARQQQNLLVLDVSGSMSAGTIRRIIEDVVALSYKADACMAVVSNTTTFWEAGSYGVDEVLAHCEYGGTHYETLAPLFDRDWGTVITVADYDSSPWAKEHLKATCVGRISQVFDISLVSRPSFLAECLGQFAADVKPLLIAAGDLTRG